jgi:hypothetical protein
MDYKIIICIVVVFILIALFFNKSTFGGPYDENYTLNGCEQNNRISPSGHVPGSWMGMTTAEKNNLKNFINNGSTI